jgi:hypothetical protein
MVELTNTRILSSRTDRSSIQHTQVRELCRAFVERRRGFEVGIDSLNQMSSVREQLLFYLDQTD